MLRFASLCWSLASNGMISRKDGPFLASPRLVDLTSFSVPLELVERLRPSSLITSELTETKKLWDTLKAWTADPNTVDSSNRSFFRQIQFTHVVHNSIFSAELYITDYF